MSFVRLLSRRRRPWLSLYQQLQRQQQLPKSVVVTRSFSDNLLGHSPMAATTSTSNKNSQTIPTAQDVTTSGGVWAPTSSKRDKLGELKAAVETGNLDDEATPFELLDLHLVDGFLTVVQAVDNSPTVTAASSSSSSSSSSSITDKDTLEEWWKSEQEALFSQQEQLTVVQWEELLQESIHRTDKQLHTLSVTDASLTGLANVRDYMSLQDDNTTELLPPTLADGYHSLVQRYRLLLLREAAHYLKDNWKLVTTISDQEVDRAAVQGQPAPLCSTLSKTKTQAVLQAFFRGSCTQRVDALWELVQRDGLLDQDGMNRVCDMAIQPVGVALQTLLQQALDAAPVREPLPPLEPSNQAPDPKEKQEANMGWRKRRQEKKVRKQLTKLFAKTVKNHFRDEVEVAHRLRCIYAWSNKQHQDNEIDSVLVDNDGLAGWSSGRKRYVELHPKIRLSEFREVQSIHFPHLDRVSQEFLGSFREDLWVRQGKGRQNAELLRECTLFLAVVSVVDYVIVCL